MLALRCQVVLSRNNYLDIIYLRCPDDVGAAVVLFTALLFLAHPFYSALLPCSSVTLTFDGVLRSKPLQAIGSSPRSTNSQHCRKGDVINLITQKQSHNAGAVSALPKLLRAWMELKMLHQQHYTYLER